MTNLEKEIDSILRFGLPDDYNEHQRKLILPRLVKWHKAKVKKLTIPVVSDTFEFDTTMLSKSDQLKFRMLLNSGVQIKNVR